MKTAGVRGLSSEKRPRCLIQALDMGRCASQMRQKQTQGSTALFDTGAGYGSMCQSDAAKTDTRLSKRRTEMTITFFIGGFLIVVQAQGSRQYPMGGT